MEDLINKATDEQFKDYLVKITDYKEDASKRDPLIKKLSRSKSTTPINLITSSTTTTSSASLHSTATISTAATTSTTTNTNNKTTKTTTNKTATTPSSTNNNKTQKITTPTNTSNQNAATAAKVATNTTPTSSKANTSTSSNHKSPPPASLSSSLYSSAASSSSTSSSSSTASDSSPPAHLAASSSYTSRSEVKGGSTSKEECKEQFARSEEQGSKASFTEHHATSDLKPLLTHSRRSRVSHANDPGVIESAEKLIKEFKCGFPTNEAKLVVNFRNNIVDEEQHRESVRVRAREATSLSQSQDQAATTSGSNGNNISSTTDVSWKTISGKRDKRRKKPAEKIVLTEDIPGHRGDTMVDIDDLVNYIESSNSSTNNNKNNRNKPQNNSKIISKNQKSQQNNNTGANITNNNIKDTITTNVITNIVMNNHVKQNTNNTSVSNKKNNHQQATNSSGTNNSSSNNSKAQQQPASSKMNNNGMVIAQAKASTQQRPANVSLSKNRDISNSGPYNVVTPTTETVKQPHLEKIDNNTDNKQNLHSLNHNHKPQQPLSQQQLVKQTMPITNGTTNNNTNSKLPSQQQNQLTRPQQPMTGNQSQAQFKQQKPLQSQTQNHNRDLNKQPQVSSANVDVEKPSQQSQKHLQQKQPQQQPPVVIFADHIPVPHEGLSQYTFGFFDEQQQQPKAQNQKPISKVTNEVISNIKLAAPSTNNIPVSNNNNHANNQANPRKQSQTIVRGEVTITKQTLKGKQQQLTASLNSEETTRYKAPKREANNFNYDQILKFISDGWNKIATSSNGH